MGWYRPAGLWRRRAAISVAIAGATPVDVNITIPPDWDEFWDSLVANADTTGANLRVVWYDGVTVLTYSLDDGAGGAMSVANRLCRIQIDGMVVPAATGMLCIWLYYDPSSAQAIGTSATVIATPVNGYIELGRPGQHALQHMPQTARSTKPRTIIHKTVLEQAFIWIRYDGALGRRVTPGNKAQVHEDPLYATMTVQNSSAADQAGMYDSDKMRWVWTNRGQMWLRIRVKAGTTATNYTAVVLARTILPAQTTADQQLETRVGIAVSDSLES